MQGILVVNKPMTMTSRDVVNILSKQFSTKKVGHTGTLDPIATGVLVVCFGKSTKLVEILTSYQKEYIFEAEFGTETDTLDRTGKILKVEKSILSREQVEEALQKMVGKNVQEVPIYSAVKVKGRKLYEYARNKEQVELPKREITIYEAELQAISYTETKTNLRVRVVVSKGTYIRAFIRDLAESLHTIGMMTSLTRTKQGNFKIEDSYSLEEIEMGKYTFVPLEEVLKEYKTIEVNAEEKEKIQNGSLRLKNTQEEVVVFTYQNTPLALYKSYEKDPNYLKPWKMF
jgi:tRNA pseudouridine55 synthase